MPRSKAEIFQAQIAKFEADAIGPELHYADRDDYEARLNSACKHFGQPRIDLEHLESMTTAQAAIMQAVLHLKAASQLLFMSQLRQACQEAGIKTDTLFPARHEKLAAFVAKKDLEAKKRIRLNRH